MTSHEFVSLPLERKVLLKELPTTNGIYQFVSKGKIIYIGKSVNLKARVLSHIESAKIDAKEAAIVNNSDELRYYITDSEFKALLFESRLINKHHPQYNVRWRDDKSYLYIKVTVKDTYPKVFLARREDDKKSKYYGPFPAVKTAQYIIRAIRKVVPYCTQKNIGKRACFYNKIGQCSPCPNIIEHLDNEDEKKRLTKEYKTNIRKVMKVLDGRSDILLDDMYKELKKYTEQEQYEEAIIVRNRIFRLEEFLNGKTLDKEYEEAYNQSAVALEKLQSILVRFYPELPLPNRIECYDISNTNQQDATASMVVMTEGLVDKKEYRKFKIKDLELQSDFDMMREVLTRRIKNKWPKPDLLVVDGGKPQVRIAQQVLAELNFDVPLIGIAKSPDRLVIGDQYMPTVRPPLNNLGFNLIRALRDESHRFAKKYHVYLRGKKMV